jgi:hypothetical protein
VESWIFGVELGAQKSQFLVIVYLSRWEKSLLVLHVTRTKLYRRLRVLAAGLHRSARPSRRCDMQYATVSTQVHDSSLASLHGQRRQRPITRRQLWPCRRRPRDGSNRRVPETPARHRRAGDIWNGDPEAWRRICTSTISSTWPAL